MKVDSEILFIKMAIVLNPVYCLIDSSGLSLRKARMKGLAFSLHRLAWGLASEE